MSRHESGVSELALLVFQEPIASHCYSGRRLLEPFDARVPLSLILLQVRYASNDAGLNDTECVTAFRSVREQHLQPVGQYVLFGQPASFAEDAFPRWSRHKGLTKKRGEGFAQRPDRL